MLTISLLELPKIKKIEAARRNTMENHKNQKHTKKVDHTIHQSLGINVSIISLPNIEEVQEKNIYFTSDIKMNVCLDRHLYLALILLICSKNND